VLLSFGVGLASSRFCWLGQLGGRISAHFLFPKPSGDDCGAGLSGLRSFSADSHLLRHIGLLFAILRLDLAPTTCRITRRSAQITLCTLLSVERALHKPLITRRSAQIHPFLPFLLPCRCLFYLAPSFCESF
jgi:hypothetical protein